MLRRSYRYLPPRLTVAEFAVVLGCCEEVVRRKIRANIHGLRRHADGPPWRISVEALPLFKVTPGAALQALQQEAQSSSVSVSMPAAASPAGQPCAA